MKELRTAAVLGRGAVGAALLRALPCAGIRVVASWTRSRRTRLPSVKGADLVLLAVSDGALAQVCDALDAGPGQLVVHLAGALGLAPLASARRRGARVGSLHPLRAFVRGRNADFSGAAAGITASDAVGRRQLVRLARALGMTPLAVREGDRALYHAAAVLAAGAEVALFAEAVRAFRTATRASERVARAALLPLSLGALDELRRAQPSAAITGPAVRADAATIRAHRAALPADLRLVYDALTRVSLGLARAGRRAPRAELARIARALKS